MPRDLYGMTARTVACEDKSPASQTFLPLPRNDLRLGGPVVLVAGISGYGRLPAGIPGRFACGIYAGCEERRRSSGDKRYRFAGIFTGATGLEPATSGVTRRSWRLRAERGSAAIPAVSG